EAAMLPLYDPQTSGGLLISVPAERADDLLAALKSRDVEWAAPIGEVTSGKGILVLP
ncbi:AIR synthase-related protein, partial [Escherichia coli]|nr:AIR synthase-related protein [Escherichia coli]